MEVPENLKDLIYGDVTVDGDRLFFRYDFDSCISGDDTDPDDHRFDAEGELRDRGYLLLEPQTEHDCVSGWLVKL